QASRRCLKSSSSGLGPSDLRPTARLRPSTRRCNGSGLTAARTTRIPSACTPYPSSLRTTITPDRIPASATCRPPPACKQPSWEVQLADISLSSKALSIPSRSATVWPGPHWNRESRRLPLLPRGGRPPPPNAYPPNGGTDPRNTQGDTPRFELSALPLPSSGLPHAVPLPPWALGSSWSKT